MAIGRLTRITSGASAASRKGQDNGITKLKICDVRADGIYMPRTLMAKHNGMRHRTTGEGCFDIGMADSDRRKLDADLVRARRGEIGHHQPRSGSRVEKCRFDFHPVPSAKSDTAGLT